MLGLLCLRIYGSFYMIHDNSIFCDLSSPWLFETTLLALVKMSLSQIRRVHLFESRSCLERILQFSSSLSSFHWWNVLRLLNLMIGFVYLQTTPKIFCNFKMDARLFFCKLIFLWIQGWPSKVRSEILKLFLLLFSFFYVVCVFPPLNRKYWELSPPS